MQQKLYSDPIKGCRFTPRKSGEIPAQFIPTVMIYESCSEPFALKEAEKGGE